MKFAIALLLIFTLTSCGPALTEKLSAQTLPDEKVYTKETQKQALVEALSGSCPILGGVFMPDYGVMRAQTRAAKKILK